MSVDLEKRINDLFLRAKRGSQKRGIPFSLTIQDISALFGRAGGRCEVTDVPFLFSECQKDGSHKRPWVPSIDRIDSSKGYTKQNCRIVCVAANIAMQDWGSSVLETMLSAMARKEDRLAQEMFVRRGEEEFSESECERQLGLKAGTLRDARRNSEPPPFRSETRGRQTCRYYRQVDVTSWCEERGISLNPITRKASRPQVRWDDAVMELERKLRLTVLELERVRSDLDAAQKSKDRILQEIRHLGQGTGAWRAP